MDSRLKGRIAIITGASSGLGKATALRFADCGARVICADLHAVGLEETIQSQHGRDSATFIKCDVTKEDEIQNLISEAVSFGGRLDIICNYAGTCLEAHERNQNAKRAHEFATEDFDLSWTVNVRGVWLCCKYALEQMLRQEPRAPNARGDRTRGWIVNAASMVVSVDCQAVHGVECWTDADSAQGVVAAPCTPAYTTAKHAVVGMTKQIALDYALDRIHVNCLCPGFVTTPMISSFTSSPENEAFLASRHPWNALGTPDDIANAALFLCSDESAWITGHGLVIDGGYTAQ